MSFYQVSLPVLVVLMPDDSGQVLKGTWNKTPVAIKVFRMDNGITPAVSVSVWLFNSGLALIVGIHAGYATGS